MRKAPWLAAIVALSLLPIVETIVGGKTIYSAATAASR